VLLHCIAFHASSASAQQALTWDQVKAKFEAANPALKADAANVDEMKAEEITAFLRPNPQFTLAADGTQIAPHNGSGSSLKGTHEQPNFSYLHERDTSANCASRAPRRERASPQSQHEDLERNMVFGLRSAFVQVLQAKAVLKLAKGRPRILRQDHRHQPCPLQGWRSCADRSRPHRTAARAIRV
jgi:outer membrane protein, heavy metal efflux system